ncbi:HAD family hydrolase [Megasphaera elsdenii]|uniref:HAD family hydrolase n=1 Tax=Megasphaera elsdenii TaxID=907 RepID=UPI0035201055
MIKNNNVCFFSDLDHTLIYSHRIQISQPKRVVEFLDGKEQSYMTHKTFTWLQKQKSFQLIPVTTRSQEQYNRIFIFQHEIPCTYSLVCNGGELLVHGIRDKMWHDETISLIQNSYDDLNKMKNVIKKIPGVKIHFVENLFFYFLLENPLKWASYLIKMVPSQNVLVLTGGEKKIYCLPRLLNKGVAIERFKRRFFLKKMFAAGDSDFDITMLNSADIAFVQPQLANKINNMNKIIISNKIFSDGICDYLSK